MECSPNGRNGPKAPICISKRIRSYPTWEVNGAMYTGVQSLDELARLSRYTGPPPSAKP